MQEGTTIKHSIFTQKIFEQKYILSDYCGAVVIQKHCGQEIDSKVLFTCDIPIPMLKVGDHFYDEDTKIDCMVLDVVRTSKDNVMYTVSTGNPIIEDTPSSVAIYKLLFEHSCIIERKNKSILELTQKLQSQWWFKLFGKKFKRLLIDMTR